MPFYTSKDALLHCKRASFRTQKGVDWKTKGKEIDKNNEARTQKKRLPQAPPEEGMWEGTVGYGGSLSHEEVPPQAPPGGGDVPGGIRIFYWLLKKSE